MKGMKEERNKGMKARGRKKGLNERDTKARHH